MAQSPKAESAFTKLPIPAKAGILLGIVVVLGLGYYVALHMSLSDEIDTAVSQHRRLEHQMEEARARNDEYLRVRRELDARSGLDDTNQHALPPTAETASFLRDLNHLSELSGLTMRLVEPRPEEPQEHYVRLPVNLELSGRYHQLARFFYNVSRLDRLISMENIHLSDPTVVGEDVILEVHVLATTFRAPDPPAAPTPAQPRAASGHGGAEPQDS